MGLGKFQVIKYQKLFNMMFLCIKVDQKKRKLSCCDLHIFIESAHLIRQIFQEKDPGPNVYFHPAYIGYYC
jgi:hypothetical protein